MAAFSKRHYEMLSAVLCANGTYDAVSDFDEGCRAAWIDIVNDIADLFARDNQAFDRQRFLDDCGITNGTDETDGDL